MGEAVRRAVDVTVIVPTLGRCELLRSCLCSLSDCAPLAGEIVVVDGSESVHVAELVDEFSAFGARRVKDDRGGAAKAANAGLREATYDTVLFTHDDCIVAPDWVGTGARLMRDYPGGLITGSVYPNGDPRSVPGLAMSSVSHDYTGTRARVLVAHNMVCPRQAVVDFGGFDERMRPVAEDDDLAFRWLRAGRTLRYAPELRVWHTAWRTVPELQEVYRVYAEGDGLVYAKHLLDGDLAMARYILTDIFEAIVAEIGALIRRKRRPWDHRLARLPALFQGLWRGLRTFGPASRREGR